MLAMMHTSSNDTFVNERASNDGVAGRYRPA
jgi:hypothetical protein